MTLAGEIRPIANKSYTYTVLFKLINAKVKSWKLEYNGKSLGDFTTGTFKFHSNLAGKTVKISAVVIANGKEYLVSTEVLVLAAVPKIRSVEWQDSYGKPIEKRKVGYLDTVKLVIYTIDIPDNDKIDVIFYEDQFKTGHGDSSRYFKTIQATVKNGRATLICNNLILYQNVLNKMDNYDESEHEYYVQIIYKNLINRIEDGIQLVIENDKPPTKRIDQPKATSNPVVVSAPPKKSDKESKKGHNVVFNMFFDGTMNNMANTGERIKNSSVYDDKSNKEDDSYTNFYSNVALLYMNNDVKAEEDIIKIYTEGIGTADKKKDQAFPGGALGTSIAIYMRGIKDKVTRGIVQMQERANEKYFSKDKEISKVTINVFGFSRGAAAARYFISQESIIKMRLNLKLSHEITFNFVGLFDTVASSGVVHINDVDELHLDLGGKPKKVVQLSAADEFRSNFKLTNIKSSIKAGVGYQLSMPGVHSDIGGGYSETCNEKRFLSEEIFFGKDDSIVMKKFDKIKEKYIKEGWYTNAEFIIDKKSISLSDKYGMIRNVYTLYGNRIGILNTYQYIPFAIMITFSEKYAKMKFKKKEIDEDYSVNQELLSVKNQLYNYAISNDGINSLAVTLQIEQLKWVINKYLHRSNQDDSPLTMGGRYNFDGKPERDILEG